MWVVLQLAERAERKGPEHVSAALRRLYPASEVVMLDGYALIAHRAENNYELRRQTRYEACIKGILLKGGEPALLSNREAARLRRACQTPLAVGDTVEVTSGPSIGLVGCVERVTRGRVTICAEHLRSRPHLELPRSAVRVAR